MDTALQGTMPILHHILLDRRTSIRKNNYKNLPNKSSLVKVLLLKQKFNFVKRAVCSHNLCSTSCFQRQFQTLLHVLQRLEIKLIYSCTKKTKKLSLRLKLDSNVI